MSDGNAVPSLKRTVTKRLFYSYNNTSTVFCRFIIYQTGMPWCMADMRGRDCQGRSWACNYVYKLHGAVHTYMYFYYKL